MQDNQQTKMVKVLDKIKIKITNIIRGSEFERFMIILKTMFERSDDERIKRTSKSLFHLLNSEKYDNLEGSGSEELGEENQENQ